MAQQEFLKLLDSFQTDPYKTLREWQRVLNHIFNNLSNSSYVVTTADKVNLTDAGSYFLTDNAEYALQYLASSVLGALTRITTKTTSATLTASEFGVVYCNSLTPITLGLPTGAAYANLSFFINNKNAGTVTVDPGGSDTIFGEATFDLYETETINIIYDGSNWGSR